ncbi:MAG: hypothetical protein UY05_C0045G0006, partial [Candidatus Peregrinibacteria bacterium GW2011_GWA2_47_7]
MSKKVFLLGVFVALNVFSLPVAHAEDNATFVENFYRARIINITAEGTNEIAGEQSPFQVVDVRFLSGPYKGETITIEHGRQFIINEIQKVTMGEDVVVSKTERFGEIRYSIIETDRTMSLLLIGAIFLGFSILFARFKGLTSIVGMVFSVLILTMLVIPLIVSGKNPLLVSLAATFLIAFVSLYMAHGFNRRTTI